jgi:hypothetical protein
MNSPRLAPAIVLAAALAAAVAVALSDGPSPLRTGAVLTFLALGPGLALVPLIGLDDAWSELTLALAVSLALDTTVAGALVYAGIWSPAIALAVLIAVSLVGAGIQVARAGRRAETP